MNRRHFLATLPSLPLAAPNTRTPPPAKPSDHTLYRWDYANRRWQRTPGMTHDVGTVYWCPAWDCLAVWMRPDGGLEYVDFPEGTIAP